MNLKDGSATKPEIAVGKRFRTLQPLAVKCWWWYDTVAILDDYSDCCESVLPAGEAFAVSQIPEAEPGHVLCELDRAAELKPTLIPKGRQIKHFLWCRPTHFSVEISRQDIASKCEVLRP